jgi:hypothetical protein
MLKIFEGNPSIKYLHRIRYVLGIAYLFANGLLFSLLSINKSLKIEKLNIIAIIIILVSVLTIFFGVAVISPSVSKDSDPFNIHVISLCRINFVLLLTVPIFEVILYIYFNSYSLWTVTTYILLTLVFSIYLNERIRKKYNSFSSSEKNKMICFYQDGRLDVLTQKEISLHMKERTRFIIYYFCFIFVFMYGIKMMLISAILIILNFGMHIYMFKSTFSCVLKKQKNKLLIHIAFSIISSLGIIFCYVIYSQCIFIPYISDRNPEELVMLHSIFEIPFLWIIKKSSYLYNKTVMKWDD